MDCFACAPLGIADIDRLDNSVLSGADSTPSISNVVTAVSVARHRIKLSLRSLRH